MARLELKPLKHQTMVITGASSGIGLCIAKQAARHGARVVLVARRQATLDDVAAEIRAAGGEAIAAAADVADRAALERAADKAIERFGGIDTWVSGAGVGLYARLEDTRDDDHRKVFETNYWGVVNSSLTALKRMKPTGGALITIGSVTSDMTPPLQGAYAATKHAVKGFINGLRIELLHEKAPISVTLIKPSGIATPFTIHALNTQPAAARVPPPAYHPNLVADAVLYAAQTPTREVVVGGAGQIMSTMAQLTPDLADRVFADLLPRFMNDPAYPNQEHSTLHTPDGAASNILGDQRVDRRFSLWTTMQTHPRLTAALALGAGAAAAGMAAMQRRPRGRSNRHSPDNADRASAPQADALMPGL
jgi:short-subunit dehydrogenase